MNISRLIRYSRACGSYQDFLDRGLLLTRKLLNQGFLVVITSKVLLSPPWLGWPLWNICVTNVHGYVPLIISTSRSFPHSWFITRIRGHLWHRYSIVVNQVMVATVKLSKWWPLGTLGSVAFLLAATLYQGNPDRYHKHWNIASTERYILHMQVLLECYW
jgi:hypothetical protein